MNEKEILREESYGKGRCGSMWRKRCKRGSGAVLRAQEVQTHRNQWKNRWVSDFCESSVGVNRILLPKLLESPRYCRFSAHEDPQACWELQKTWLCISLSLATLWRTTLNNLSCDLGLLKAVVGKFLHPQTQHQILLSTTALSWNTSLMWGLHSILKQHMASALEGPVRQHAYELCKVKGKIRSNGGKN